MSDEQQIIKEYDQLIGRHKKLIEFMCQRASYGQDIHYSDLIQECYIEILTHMLGKRIKRLEIRESLWVYMQCRHAITRYRRAVKKFPKVIHDMKVVENTEAYHEVSKLTVDDLAACLDGAERRCFLLLASGIPDEEIEQKLNIKHRTLIQMRYNIKRKLKKYIIQ